ncbi:MAG: hypothetical protein JSU70_11890 [Phycisphaerales bacterium]|nr:MAG: hypothetical protein JSU70_11890 [Phycisphaerales bacterium]
MPRIVRLFAVAILTGPCALALGGESVSEEPQDSSPRDAGPNVKIGEFAPDFELPKLTLATDEEGESVGIIGETGTVRLSSFRGKKPVCLFMSSYT